MRNGSGGYSLPVNTWNPATTGVSATVTDWQALINDIATAMQQSVSSDGQTAMTGNLAMGNNKLTGLSAGTATGHSLRWEQLFSQGTIANLASATTTDIGAQNTSFLNITGTTTITGFGSNFNGPRYLVFAGILTLTHSATLVCPGAANITTAAGDACIVVPISGGWKIVSYDKYSGLPTSTTGLAASGANNDITSLAALASVPSVVTTAITTATPASSATVSGLVELATTAETETGTDATRAATPAGLKGALLFSNGFESSDQTVTANSKLTIAHGLGAKPKFFQTFLKCNTAEANYTAGDEIEFTNMDVAGVSTCSTSSDATNMYIVHAGALRVNDKNTPFTTVTITTTSWRWVVRAWA